MEGLLSKYEFLSEVMAEKNRLDIMQILTN